MAATETVNVRILTIDEVGDYVAHMVRLNASSGVDGEAHSHVYSKSEPVNPEAARDQERTRWSTAVDEPGWRRARGLFDGDELVGHIYLAGGSIRSELHRVNMGMGIVRPHRRRGGGTSLLETAIEWVRLQPGIVWIDLGVFSDNPGAQALYELHGFEVVGRTSDRFRVDGCSLDDISMTLMVASPSEPAPVI